MTRREGATLTPRPDPAFAQIGRVAEVPLNHSADLASPAWPMVGRRLQSPSCLGDEIAPPALVDRLAQRSQDGCFLGGQRHFGFSCFSEGEKHRPLTENFTRTHFRAHAGTVLGLRSHPQSPRDRDRHARLECAGFEVLAPKIALRRGGCPSVRWLHFHPR